jgi:hypothetical protein
LEALPFQGAMRKNVPIPQGVALGCPALHLRCKKPCLHPLRKKWGRTQDRDGKANLCECDPSRLRREARRAWAG